MILLGLYTGLLLLYMAVITLLAVYWRQIPERDIPTDWEAKTSFTIIIPFRNEAPSLKAICSSLARINYPKSHYEIILVDDHSEDDSMIWAKQFLANLDNVYFLSNEGEGKKSAISTAIAASKGDYLVTIDADCIVSSTILFAYDHHIVSSGSDMVVGPVEYVHRSWWSSLLNYELMGLVGLAGASIAMNNPTTANGANLCFRKNTFLQLNGYHDNLHVASGDDEFLLHSMKKAKATISFLKSPHAIVHTQPPASLKEFIRQRIRWSSKFTSTKNAGNIIAPLFLWVLYGVQTSLFFFPAAYAALTLLLTLKIVAEAMYMRSVLSFFKKRRMLFLVLAVQVVYPCYILFIGIISLFSTSYIWKNRTVK